MLRFSELHQANKYCCAVCGNEMVCRIESPENGLANP